MFDFYVRISKLEIDMISVFYLRTRNYEMKTKTELYRVDYYSNNFSTYK